MAVVAEPEDQLAWEARQRPRAGVVALVAAVLLIGSILWGVVSLRDLPRTSYLQSLGQAFQPGPEGSQPSLQIPVLQYYDDRAFAVVGASLLRGLSYLAFAWVLVFLATATRARRPEMSKLVVYTALVGPVLQGVGAVLGGVGTVLAAATFLDGSRTVDAARDVGTNPLLIAASLLSQNLGPLLMAAGLLLVALNAMRVGLLTRFLGILGMVTGGLAVLSEFSPPLFAFITTFWLISLSLIFLDRAPGGTPPSWRTGKPEPWPSQREVAEMRRAARGPKREPQAEPEPAAVARGPSGRQHPSSRKRKRKRRG
jgi:hypothetical protein